MLWWIVGSGFLASLLCPVVEPRARRAMGLLAGGVPAALFVLLGVLRSSGGEWVAGVSISWVQELDLQLALRLDGLSAYFALIITGVSAGVFVYAGGYTHHWREGRGAFFGLLQGFMASMLGLVLAGDLLTLYVFWELTTVFSFLLIGFELEAAKARRAALQALVVTGGGGLLLLGGILLLGQEAGTFALDELLAGGPLEDTLALRVAVVLIGLGALIKTAQFPFHFWLTGAMVAPTPVSAHLHSATMVKAGLFLLARLLPVLGHSAWWAPLLLGTALLSLLVATYGCLAVRDLKEMLAYSTIGALAVGLACLGVGTVGAMKVFATFLLAHAGYKACLFMVAGGVQEQFGSRDATELGRLARWAPGLAVAAALGALGMIEVGPVIGFIAKELAFEEAWKHLGASGVGIFGLAAVGFTVVALVIAVRIFFGGRAPPPETPAHTAPSLWWPALLLGFAGIPLAFAAGWVGRVLVEPLLAATVPAADPSVHLALWNGWKWPLAATAVTLVLGSVAAITWKPVQQFLARGNRWVLDGTGRLGATVSKIWIRGSALQRDVVEHGRLPLYALAVVLAAALATLPWAELEWNLPAVGTAALIEDGLLALFVLAGAFLTMRVRDRAGMIASLSVLGFGLTLVYLRFSAPDVALTHVLVETLLVVLFAGVVRSLPSIQQFSSRGRVILRLIVAAGGGLAVTLSLLGLVARDRSTSAVAGFYLEQIAADAHRDNAVGAVITDFRAFDTLGEITVLAAAAVGVFHLMRTYGGNEEESP